MRRVALFVLVFLAFGVLLALALSSTQFPQAWPAPFAVISPWRRTARRSRLIACGIRGWISAARF